MLTRVLVTVMFVMAVGWCTPTSAVAQPALADHRLMVSEHTVVRDLRTRLVRSFHPVVIRATYVPDSLVVGEESLFSAVVNVEHATLPIAPTWEFSDGTMLSGLSVRRTFTRPGRYRLRFHVENRGSEASRMFEVQVHENGGGGLSEQYDEDGCNCE